jgi:hypothetical protein
VIISGLIWLAFILAGLWAQHVLGSPKAAVAFYLAALCEAFIDRRDSRRPGSGR